MFLAFFSLLHDWVLASEIQENIPSPIFNIDFFASLMFIGFFGFIILIGHKMSSANSQNQIANFMSYTVLVIFLVSIYYTFRFEIEHYWNQLYQNLISSSESKLIQNKGQNLIELKKITTLDYSLLFVSLLSFINIYQTKSKRISLANILLNIIVVGYFLTQGLLILRELRIIYFSMSIFQDSTVYFFVRYVSYALVGLVLLACKQYVDSKMIKDDFKIPIELIVMLTILWILSSELVNQLAIYGKKDLFKLEITILWGVFSMILVVLGIWKVKKHLRVMAIVLFGVTLIKLFIYDISHLNTVSKTIVFVALGVLLLIISFLYNKYRHIISEDEIK